MKPLTAYSLRAERVALTIGAVMTVLIVLHVLAMQANFNPALGLKERFGFHYWQLSLFDLDEEESFGTWFNSGILLIAAALLVHQARVLRAQEGAWHRSWLVLGIGFLVLSVDEIAGMHEFVNTMMGDTPWTVIGFPILVLVALAYLPFLWHRRGPTGLLFLLAGVLFRRRLGAPGSLRSKNDSEVTGSWDGTPLQLAWSSPSERGAFSACVPNTCDRARSRA